MRMSQVRGEAKSEPDFWRLPFEVGNEKLLPLEFLMPIKYAVVAGLQRTRMHCSQFQNGNRRKTEELPMKKVHIKYVGLAFVWLPLIFRFFSKFSFFIFDFVLFRFLVPSSGV